MERAGAHANQKRVPTAKRRDDLITKIGNENEQHAYEEVIVSESNKKKLKELNLSFLGLKLKLENVAHFFMLRSRPKNSHYVLKLNCY